MIETWILTIASLTIGYLLGAYSRDPEHVQQLAKKLRKAVTKKDVGIVRTPSRDEQAMIRNPKLKEEEEAWDESLPAELRR